MGKLYLPELDALDFVQRAANQPVIVTARLSLFEMQRLAFRKEGDGLIPAGSAEMVVTQVEQDIAAHEIRVIDIDAKVEAEFGALLRLCYRRTPVLAIRTFDAVHLATARAAGETEVVTTDKKMRDAAKLVGLSLFPV